MVHRSSFPPVPCTPYSSYNCLPLTRRDLAYTYSCCRWAVHKHRWKYNLFHCFKPHVVVLAHLDNSVASWRWVLWPFVPWPFVSVAFCLVAFCLWPYVRWPFVPWPFVCTPSFWPGGSRWLGAVDRSDIWPTFVFLVLSRCQKSKCVLNKLSKFCSSKCSN